MVNFRDIHQELFLSFFPSVNLAFLILGNSFLTEIIFMILFWVFFVSLIVAESSLDI